MIRALSSMRASLLLRIFLVMLVSAVAVQLISVAALFLLPAPMPRLFSVEQISVALRTGRDDSGTLRLSDRAPPDPAAQQTPRAARLQALLARRLGVTPSKLRFQILHEPRFPPGMGPRRPMPGGGGFPMAMLAQNGRPDDELILGDFAVSVQRDGGAWRTVQPARGFADFWRWRALSWLLAALLAIAPFAWWLARRITRPIAAFGRAAERLGRDPRSPPVPVRGPPEIADAAAAFNQMQARLSRYIDDRSMLLAAVAHDLRTPLMRIAFRMENAPAPLREATQADINDMQAMLVSTLALVRDLTVPPKRQQLDLRPLMESVTDSFRDNGDDVQLDPGGAVVIEGDRAELKRLFGNLIRNAVLYGGAAEVTIGADATVAWVEVRDNGPGIPDALLARVFEPFFRVETSRNRASGGTGLGLSSAQAIAHAHGGTIILSNRDTGGLVARVTLPRLGSCERNGTQAR